MASPRYRLEIDEEGWPKFGELRIDDTPLVHELLSGIVRRIPEDSSSSLITYCQGEALHVHAFDDPWVVQYATILPSEKKLKAFMPGNFWVTLSLSDLRMDEFGRLRARFGNGAIPISFSRRAQADFLAQVPNLEQFVPSSFRQDRESVGQASRWTQYYQDSKDAWDLGRAHPALQSRLMELEKHLQNSHPNVVVPGCGRGHDANALWEHGWEPKPIDFSFEAISEIQKLYPKLSPLAVCGNVFDQAALFKSANLVFEHTFYCAIPPELRAKWWDFLKSHLPQGSLYAGWFYTKTGPSGPPFGTNGWELREHWGTGWDVMAFEAENLSPPKREEQEYWFILKSR